MSELAQLASLIERAWSESILDRLQAYVRIPCKSPLFDPDWERNGHIEAAMQLAAEWCRQQRVPGIIKVDIRRLPNRTPLLFVDVPGELPGLLMLYGHLDKQPEFTGWAPGLSPWEPVLRDGRLYGRGSADDGYAVFAALTAIAVLKSQGVPLARCVLLIEASEESASIDLPAHLDALAGEIGEPSLVVCLDADCGDYERLWCTTSLRGLLNGRLQVRVLTEGVHSMASGIVPTPFRIVQQLLARIEDLATGEIWLEGLNADIPNDRRRQIAAAAQVLGDQVAGKYPWAPDARPQSDDAAELIANSTWRARLAVTGADGLPPVSAAGNVLLPELSLKLSLRLPPACPAARAASVVKQILEADPPYGAPVSFDCDPVMEGWSAPDIAPWLERSLARASHAIFGKEAMHVGSGGSIPFMALLGHRFPSTQFWVTGVLGPHSNAHGPNEFLHIDYAKKLTACVALVLADHADEMRRTGIAIAS